MTTLIIDADYLVYSTAAACQQQYHWDDDVITTHINLGDAKNVLLSAMEDIASATRADITDEDSYPRVALCWSDPSRRYFRHTVDPTYKSHRRGSVVPLGVVELRDWLTSQHSGYTLPGLEGDDVCGLLATGYQLLNECDGGLLTNRIIVGVDKDLRQIPGVHFNPNRPDAGLVYVSPAEGHLFHATQALTGDPADGYPGCPGIGPVRAARLLASGSDKWLVVRDAFVANGLTEHDAAVQWNLAGILTTKNYDFKWRLPFLDHPSASYISPQTVMERDIA